MYVNGLWYTEVEQALHAIYYCKNIMLEYPSHTVMTIVKTKYLVSENYVAKKVI